MTAKTGKRQDGRISNRCLDNTGARRFLIAEFDFRPSKPDEPDTPDGRLLSRLAAERNPRDGRDLCAALLLHLKALGAPLLMAVHSGGKSVHGWFPTFGASDPELDVGGAERLPFRSGPNALHRSKRRRRIPAG